MNNLHLAITYLWLMISDIPLFTQRDRNKLKYEYRKHLLFLQFLVITIRRSCLCLSYKINLLNTEDIKKRFKMHMKQVLLQEITYWHLNLTHLVWLLIWVYVYTSRGAAAFKWVSLLMLLLLLLFSSINRVVHSAESERRSRMSLYFLFEKGNPQYLDKDLAKASSLSLPCRYACLRSDLRLRCR